MSVFETVWAKFKPAAAGNKIVDASDIAETSTAVVMTPDERGKVGRIDDFSSSARAWSALTATITAGKYVRAADGVQVPFTGYDFAEVALNGGETLRITGQARPTPAGIAVFLDASGNFISGVAGPSAVSSYTRFPVTAPINARMMRSSVVSGTIPLIEQRVVAARLRDATKAGTSLLRYESANLTPVTGKYIQASDGTIQSESTYSYIEMPLSGDERGIKISAKAVGASVSYSTFIDATGQLLSAAPSPSSATQLTDQLVVVPAGARLMRVCGKSDGVLDIKVLDVEASVSGRVDALTATSASALATANASRASLSGWQTPTQTIVSGKYIRASDGTVQTDPNSNYAEYTLTGTEQGIRITADAFGASVALVAWYDTSTAVMLPTTPATSSHVLHTQETVTPPAGAAKLRVTSYTTTAPLIEINDLLPGVGALAQTNAQVGAANAAAITTVRGTLGGWQTPAQTVTTGKYIGTDGVAHTSPDFAYAEYALTGTEQSIRITVDAFLAATLYVSWANAAGYIAGSGTAATSSHVTHTQEVVTPPAGATKLRVCGYITGSFTPFIEIKDVVPSLGQKVLDLQAAAASPGAVPTVYGFDYTTGTAFANDALTTTDYMILVVGTSWSGGYNQEGDAPVTTSAVDSGYALMFDAGAYPNGATVNSYVDLYERSRETPCSGIASAILSRLNARLGFKPRVLMAVGGKVGNAYAGGTVSGTGNKRGSDAYKECLRLVSRAKAISAAQGRRLKVLCIAGLEGENELNIFPLQSERQFIDAMRQQRLNLADDIKRILAQDEPIPLITYQTSWASTSAIGILDPVRSAQLKIHDRDPLIFQAGPVYYVPENPGGGHTTAAWYRRIGRQLGVAIVEALFGPYFQPLQVIDSYWVSSTEFCLRFSEAIALETDDSRITLSTLLNPAGKGLEFMDASTRIDINGLTIQTSPAGSGSGTISDLLKVSLASAPTSLRRRVLGASHYQSGHLLGRDGGGRTGIRSAASIDTDPLDGYVLSKWAMAEDVKL